MSAALWIGGAALIVLVAGWRLRRAARTMRRIVAEERERAIVQESERTEDTVTKRPPG